MNKQCPVMLQKYKREMAGYRLKEKEKWLDEVNKQPPTILSDVLSVLIIILAGLFIGAMLFNWGA